MEGKGDAPVEGVVDVPDKLAEVAVAHLRSLFHCHSASRGPGIGRILIVAIAAVNVPVRMKHCKLLQAEQSPCLSSGHALPSLDFGRCMLGCRALTKLSPLSLTAPHACPFA